MIIIPAIDLMNGKCVRLIRGEQDKKITYKKTAMEVAEEYESMGVRLIHVVDMDGAFTGKMKNLDIIRSLAKKFPIQVGGGVRSESAIKQLLENGVEKVILGTLLFKNQDEAAQLKKKYFGKLIGSFDFKDGKLSYAGWTKTSRLKFSDLVSGLSEIVVTDISRDGTYRGPNLDLLKSIMQKTNSKLIAAGGVLDIPDLFELRKINVYGAIVGRAFLEGKIRLRDGYLMEGEDADVV
ncbi:Imidazole glycerol phosphate synthase subunit HisF [Candidatus Bilamarchaeum dharawalense]|uniref:1-(5-phosphoribosyl)-5-[(5-phosphoribosylamino)methylideneamino] imidazole-4-carboxamide isomerase n=1 Tax=Candidatus Bilamarchaeum dharawalense TaxID=2885759 RepID=A0A5E4LSC7_9ARCH|nr:Imidazole glycerol phosphate synthase subunit HisF [Candidatus Bilamarchaeum dharawalense]